MRTASPAPRLRSEETLWLVICIVCVLILGRICLTWFEILNSNGLMSSRVDGRGGLWEISFVVPLLALTTVVSALRLYVLQRYQQLAIFLAAGAAAWLLLGFILVHFIRTALR